MTALLGWIMIGGSAAIFVLVLAVAALAIWARGAARRWLGGHAAVVWGGVVFPVVTLSALLVYGLAVAAGLASPPVGKPLRIAVVGERWWWRVHYLGEDGALLVASANEIRLPVGRPVEILLTTADVIHSFWLPGLAGKLDMIPGRENRLVLQADRAGRYRGQCAEYCGGAHALMAFDVVAQTPAEFERWLAAQQTPSEPPRGEELTRGRRVFAAIGCGACHTVRGTDAAGLIGPDLTHVGGRLTLAAGALANNPGAVAAWITHSQTIKPGNGMPSFEIIAPADLRALAGYLESLR